MSQPSPDHIDTAKVLAMLNGILRAWRPTSSTIDRRLRRHIVEVHRHLWRNGGDPLDLIACPYDTASEPQMPRLMAGTSTP